MDSIFNVPISIYNGVTDNKGAQTTLRAFLFSTRHKDEVLRIREVLQAEGKERYKELKKRLPMATVSGLFAERKYESLRRHSGFICLDIDAQDNPHFSSNREIFEILKTRPEVAYAGLSVSGNGYFALIPLLQPGLHLQHFMCLRREYGALGINIDEACKDVTRTRFVSFDPAPYINEQAVLYSNILEEDVHVFANPSCSSSSNTSAGASAYVGGLTDFQKVQRCVERIVGRGLDITSGYANWCAIGMSLSALGEPGREFFHEVSRFNGDYNHKLTDEKFTNFLRTTKRTSIATFLSRCKGYGVNYGRSI